MALLEDALAAALGAAPAAEPVRRWLARCAGWEGPLPAAVAGASVDAILDQKWQARPEVERRLLGQVFTPRALARRVLAELAPDPDGALLDPACGGGVFLAEAVARRAGELAGPPAEVARRILGSVHGLDLDPEAVHLARLLVGLEIARRFPAEVLDGLPLPSVREGDATLPGAFDGLGPIRWVVGNPPYLEAKRMPKDQRERLRRRFAVDGAYDLYVCFVLLALDLVGRDGGIGFVLPNKLLVARYAAALRERLLAEGRVRTLIDLSAEGLFGGVGVYPIVAVLRPAGDAYEAVAREARTRVPHPLARKVGAWWVPPDRRLGALVERLVDALPPLADLATARSTVSFHAKGLRERYVRPGDELPDGLPYLGGRSFARRNEVAPYRVEWQGFRIRYAQDELRAIGNPLPPLALFQRPKVILCQHARRGTAFWDGEGRYVCKDVYPVVLPRDPEAGAALCAILNSRVFSVVYAVLFHGIAISGGYLHFLPVFLHRVPVPRHDPAAARALADAVVAVQASGDPDAIERIDAEVAALYGLGPDERAIVRAHAVRLGFP